MADTLERLVVMAAVTVVCAAIGLVLRSVRDRRNRKNFPDAEGVASLIVLIQEWKAKGLDYRERVQLLMERGLRRDVADTLLGEAERQTKNGPSPKE